jgi:hypothetical protein
VIGKSLRQRHTLAPLAAPAAIAVVTELLASHAEPVVAVRAKDARMIACLVARADEASVRLCKSLGFRVPLGGSLVFGLLGADAARLLAERAHVAALSASQRAWLEAPCGPRETKVLLFAAGLALVSLEAKDGIVAISVHDDASPAPRPEGTE